jgi:hypothetical protein
MTFIIVCLDIVTPSGVRSGTLLAASLTHVAGIIRTFLLFCKVVEGKTPIAQLKVSHQLTKKTDLDMTVLNFRASMLSTVGSVWPDLTITLTQVAAGG